MNYMPLHSGVFYYMLDRFFMNYMRFRAFPSVSINLHSLHAKLQDQLISKSAGPILKLAGPAHEHLSFHTNICHLTTSCFRMHVPYEAM